MYKNCISKRIIEITLCLLFITSSSLVFAMEEINLCNEDISSPPSTYALTFNDLPDEIMGEIGNYLSLKAFKRGYVRRASTNGVSCSVARGGQEVLPLSPPQVK